MNTQHVTRRFRRFCRATQAVAALEYAIMVGVVTVAIGAAVVTFSDTVSEVITGIGDNIEAAQEDRGEEEAADE